MGGKVKKLFTTEGTEVTKVDVFSGCGRVRQFLFTDEFGRTFCGNAETKEEALRFAQEVRPLPKGDRAIVIMVGDRYFHSIKNGRIKTGWHIASAQMFQGGVHDPFYEKAKAVLTAKKKKFTERTVGLI